MCCIFLCCIFSCCILLLYFSCCIFSCCIFLCYIYSVLYFSCCIFFIFIYILCCIKTISLSATVSSDICSEDFWSDSKEDFSLSWELGMIQYLMICLRLFHNYLSVIKLNFMLISFLILIILVPINDTV